MPKTVAEQISEYGCALTAKQQRMASIMSDSADKGETLDSAQEEEYDTLKAEVASIEKHLGRLHDVEKVNLSLAKAVPQTPKTLEDGTAARNDLLPRVRVQAPLKKANARSWASKTISCVSRG
jgi:hypothetical protein